MKSHGTAYPDILVWGAVLVELGGGLMLIAGFYARWAALALFFYTLTLALIFHVYWAAPEATARTEPPFFFGHLSMMGGISSARRPTAGFLIAPPARLPNPGSCRN
jgi:putative oxidoreductase